MTSRTTVLVDFNNGQASDVAELLEQVGVSVQVYRSVVSTEDKVGFGTEVPASSFIGNILAHIEATRQTREVSSEAGKGTEMKFIGITGENDVRVNDIWKLKRVEYRIVSVDSSSLGKTEVSLEVKQ